MIDMKTFALLCISLGLISVASAGSHTADSDALTKIYLEMNDTLAATGGWNKKPLATRNEAFERAIRLEGSVKKLLGNGLVSPRAACRNAAIHHRYYVKNLNDAALVIEGKKSLETPADLYAPMFHSVQFGQSLAECHTAINSI